MNNKFYCPMTGSDYEMLKIMIIRGSVRISVSVKPRFENSIYGYVFQLNDIEKFININCHFEFN